jgi:heterodisulfide reductase subunit A
VTEKSKPSKGNRQLLDRQVLIVGAGIAGISAALRLARQGITVHLVEKEASPGGWAATYGCKAAEACVKCSVCVVAERTEELLKASGIYFHPNSTVETVDRRNLCFLARISRNGDRVGGKKRMPPEKIGADAILVATGFKPYDALHKGEYGWHLHPDVITGLEAEQMLLEKGELLKSSDGKPPEKVAFIQCVGSRYAQHDTPVHIRTYCSTVCCAYALRMANLLVKRENPAEVTIFYMDLQNYGKGFNPLLDGCREKIRFIRTIPSRINKNAKGALEATYESLEEGKVVRDDFDLIILSIGMEPRDDAHLIAELLDLRENEHGFFEPLHPDETTLTGREGIFMAGTCVSPKTIASTILEAEKAADHILKYLEDNKAIKKNK